MTSDSSEPLDDESLGDSELDLGLRAAFAGTPPQDSPAQAPSRGLDALYSAGSVVDGRYHLLEPIGEGGMGTVWMAEQRSPVRRMVALKLIKPGMDSRAVVARFEAERQALALMEHPNIAKVLDGGMTEHGHPYFVMELVKGVPITDYCDARRLTPHQRLELLIPVCNAIQHAHQKGIIHRDIKPSNILVALYDDMAIPKIIDFGVAKATGGRLTEATLYTGFNAMIGTFEYMAPEQALLNNRDIDTRADIYSLGVLMYELLTGAPPFHRSQLSELALDEILRAVREYEPIRPSLKFSSAEAKASIAAVRSTLPQSLQQILSGDLEWIIMKALEKDRSRRYTTAIGLGEDISRFMANLPVTARPPSHWYLFRKFARRHSGLLATSGLLIATLCAATIVSIFFAWQASISNSRAFNSEQTAIQREKQARKNLELAMQAVDEYCDRIADDPRLVRDDFQSLRRSLLENAIKFQTSLLDSRNDLELANLEIARTHIRLARVLTLIGDKQAADGHYDLGIAEFQQHLNQPNSDKTVTSELAEDISRYATLSIVLGNPQAAEPKMREAYQLALDYQTQAPDTPAALLGVSRISRQLSRILLLQVTTGDTTARLAEAESLLKTAHTLANNLLASDTDNLTYMTECGECELQLAGFFLNGQNISRYRESTPHIEASLAIYDKILAQHDDPTGQLTDSLAIAWAHSAALERMSRRREAAIQALKRSVELRRSLVKTFPSNVEYRFRMAYDMNYLTLAMSVDAPLGEMELIAQQARDAWRIVAELDPKNTIVSGHYGTAYHLLAGTEIKQGKTDDGMTSLNRAIELCERSMTSEGQAAQANLASALLSRSDLLLNEGKLEQALTDIDRSIELSAPSAILIPNFKLKRAKIQASLGQWREAAAEAYRFNETIDHAQPRGNVTSAIYAAEVLMITARAAQAEANSLNASSEATEINDAPSPPANSPTELTELVKKHHELALEFIRISILLGYDSPESLISNSYFSELNPYEQFQTMVEQLRKSENEQTTR